MPAERIVTIWAHCSLHSAARNDLCRRAMGDYLLMLDTDMQHQADALCRLRRTMLIYKADVVTGLYYKTDVPHFPVLWAWDEEDTCFRQAVMSPNATRPFKINGGGGGILMVSAEIIERVKEEYGTDPFDIEPGVAAGHPPFGEDLSFFRKLMLLDPKPLIMCHPGVVSSHLVWQKIGPDDHLREVKKLSFEQPDGKTLDPTIILRYGDGETVEAKRMLTGGEAQ